MIVSKSSALNISKSEAAWPKTLRYIPNGVQTFSKAPMQHVDGVSPKYTVRGKGAYTWDLDGNKYLDCMGALGPLILGHADETVNAAVSEVLAQGNLMSLNHPMETELSEKLCELIPCAEQVRFGKNGSDVTSAAIRIARGYTKRDKVAVCGYHGWQDWYIGSTPRNLGVPKAVQELTLKFEYNNAASLKKLFADNSGEIAAVIMEPVTFYKPKDGFLEEVQALAKEHGAVLIFDEVITGFRASIHGVQKEMGVTPDLATFGKAMANGFSISAVVGKAPLMKLFEDVFFSATFGAELTSIAASLATIDVLEKNEGTALVRARGDQFMQQANASIKALGAEELLDIAGYNFWPAYLFKEHQGYTPLVLQTLFQQEFIRRGVLSRAGVMLTMAHSKDDITFFGRAFEEALAVVVEAVKSKQVDAWIDGKVIEPVIRKKA